MNNIEIHTKFTFTSLYSTNHREQAWQHHFYKIKNGRTFSIMWETGFNIISNYKGPIVGKNISKAVGFLIKLIEKKMITFIRTDKRKGIDRNKFRKTVQPHTQNGSNSPVLFLKSSIYLTFNSSNMFQFNTTISQMCSSFCSYYVLKITRKMQITFHAFKSKNCNLTQNILIGFCTIVFKLQISINTYTT